MSQIMKSTGEVPKSPSRSARKKRSESLIMSPHRKNSTEPSIPENKTVTDQISVIKNQFDADFLQFFPKINEPILHSTFFQFYCIQKTIKIGKKKSIYLFF